MRFDEVSIRPQTSGWIDSMSVTQVVQSFEVFPQPSYPDGWDIPRTVTSLLMCTDNVGLAPGLSIAGISSAGPIGSVTRELIKSGVISTPPLSNEIKKKAIAQTKRQVTRNSDRLREDYEKFLTKDALSIQEWMDWTIHSAWVEHAQNFGGLIDIEFVPNLARLLNVTENDLKDLQEFTSSLSVVKNFIRHQPDTDSFNMTYQCFLLGALIRGVYHDNLAKCTDQQVAPHRFRTVMLPTTKHSISFEETSVESYLTNIVLHSALMQRNLKSRLLCWANNIGKIRSRNKAGYEEIDLRPTRDPELAKQKAVSAAKTAGIEVHPQWVEWMINASQAATIGFAGSFLLEAYQSMALAGVDFLLISRTDMGKTVANKIYGNTGHLSKLAESPPGRIIRRA